MIDIIDVLNCLIKSNPISAPPPKKHFEALNKAKTI